MELITTILEATRAFNLALLAIPERHLYVAAFVTPILFFGALLLRAFLSHKTQS